MSPSRGATPSKLEEAWADRVRANRVQAERFRETQPSRLLRPGHEPVRRRPAPDRRAGARRPRSRMATPDDSLARHRRRRRPLRAAARAQGARGHRGRAVRQHAPRPPDRHGRARRSTTSGSSPGAWPDALDELGPLPAVDMALIAHVALRHRGHRRRSSTRWRRRPATAASPCSRTAARRRSRTRSGRSSTARSASRCPALPELVALLEARGRTVEVETSGAIAAHVRLRPGADGVPAPPAVHRRGRREGRPLPRDPARAHHPPRGRRLDPRGASDRRPSASSAGASRATDPKPC